MELTQRQQEILTAVVQEYSKNGNPVASKDLARAYHFEYSSATIRAEMSQLEKDGLLEKPHTSAGRIPTEKGYRFYVKELMHERNLPSVERQAIKIKINKIKEQNDFPKGLAEILSDLSQSLALVGRNQESHFYFSGLEEMFDQVDREMSTSIAHFLEEAERDFEGFFEESSEEPNIFIGNDHPMLSDPKCGLILSRYKKGKDKGVLALVGSSRMNYERNVSLLRYIGKLLD